jgi:hypothetical protein
MTAQSLSASFRRIDIAPDHPQAIAHEAARILSAVLDFVHVVGEHRGMVSVTADLPADLFDRMTVWGVAVEDFEDQGDAEDGADAERDEAN